MCPKTTLFIIILSVNNVFSQNYFYYPQQQYFQQQQFQNVNPSPQQVFYPQLQQQQPQQYFVQYYPPQQQTIQFTNIPKNVQPVIIIEQPQKQIQQVPHRQATGIVVSMETFGSQPKQIASTLLSPKYPAKFGNTSADKLEFDLPPPPPSQFLPNNELDKIKIAELIAQQHHHQIEQTRIKPEIRIQQHQTEQNLALQKQAILNQQIKQIEQQRQDQLLLQNQQLLSQQQRQQQLIQQIQQQKQLQQQLLLQQKQQQLVKQQEINALKTKEPIITTIKTDFVQEVTAGTTRALSSKKNAEPNKIFLKCCKKKNVDKTCESRCSFDKINKKILTQMFLGSDPCPQKYGLDLFSCAAQDSDHTTCCKTKNVQRTTAGNKCLAFCNLTPDSQFQADASYLPCWGVLNDVKNCFKESILISLAA